MNATRTLPAFVLQPAARALNASLAADPEAKRILASLDDRRIAVEVSDLAVVIAVGIRDGQLELGGPPGEPDATVAGRMADLLGAARNGNPKGLTVSGDAELVQGLARVMSRLPRAAWERVATVLGEGPARTLERLAESLTKTLRDTRERFTDSVAEYLQHEARLLVPRHEVEEFLAEIDALRDDTDRLAKRIERLARARGG